jgi:hypothetical protein
MGMSFAHINACIVIRAAKSHSKKCFLLSDLFIHVGVAKKNDLCGNHSELCGKKFQPLH